MDERQARDERFVRAVRENRASMFRVARTMLRSNADAEDAVSEATVSAYAHIAALRNWDTVRAWLMRITVNACHQTLRRRKREQPVDDSAFAAIPAREADPMGVFAYVERLDAKYSVPLTMFYSEDMRIEEIAGALRIPLGTVGSRLARGRKLLKALIEKEEGER